MNEKESIWGYVIAFLAVGALGFGVYWFFLKDNSPAPTPETNNNQDENKDEVKDDGNNDETPVDQTPTNDDVKEDNEDTTSNTDFSSFTNSNQSVGKASNEGKYTIKSVTDTNEDGYHSFKFNVQAQTSDVMEVPYVVVKYNSGQSAIRVDFAGVTKDESGIGYQKSRSINKEGVIRLYHNISSDSSEELYDIGVSAQTVFKLTSKELPENTWEIKVDVKYPGTTDDSDSELGSTEFTRDTQSIVGGVSADSAKVLSYSYSNSAGIVTIAFNVSGSSSKPIPSAVVTVLSSNKIKLEFSDVVSDSSYSSLNGKTVGGLSFATTRSGNKSSYTITGSTKEFKLYGTKSPNQVVLEIKL